MGSRVMKLFTLFCIISGSLADSIIASIISGTITPTTLGVSGDDFYRAFTSPNLTAAYPLQVSQESSSNDAPWSLDISVTADVLLNSTASSTDFFQITRNGTTIVTLISLKSPISNVSSPTNSSMCATVLGGLSDSAMSNGQSDDGTCGDTLSETCIQDIQKAALEGGTCGIKTIPNSCSSYWGNARSTSAQSITESNINGPALFAAKTLYDSNEGLYRQSIESVWPVVVTYPGSSTAAGDGSSSAAVRCLRANQNSTSLDNSIASYTGSKSGAAVTGSVRLDMMVGALVAVGAWMMW